MFLGVLGCLQVSATLKSVESATLLEHLQEVNKEWVWACDFLSDQTLQQTTHFTDDTQRIQTHLWLVTTILEAKNKLAFTPDQANKRQKMLTALTDYWQTGIFPKNDHHNTRIPYFIDEHNTACAVGHLLLESQHEAMAHRINQENNNAYIRQMPYPELLAWATEFGFTVDELAWIQPAYAPNQLWESLHSGTDGTIHTIIRTANNDLIIGGDFTQASNLTANNIVAWNGYHFTPLGDGLTGVVRTLAMHNGQLYAGGSFTDNDGNPTNLAVWNGTSWAMENVFGGTIWTLYVFDNQLHAAGNLSDGRIVRQNNSTWETAASGFNGAIYSLIAQDGNLVAGGAFTQIGFNAAPHIARQNGAFWQAVGGGLNSTVRTLAVDNGVLYAGGDFFDTMGNTAFGMAKLEADNWQNLIDVNIMQASEGEGHINAMLPYNGKLFFGGNFNAAVAILQIGRNIATLNISDGTIAPLGWADEAVNALVVQSERLFMGGDFEWLFEPDNSQHTQHLAFTELAATPARLKVLLEGAYDVNTGMMTTELRAHNLLPTTQPFNRAPWNYEGTESVNSLDNIPANAVDWILVEARNSSDNELVLDRCAAFLLADGSIVDVSHSSAINFKNIPANSAYNISIHHRNHLAILSAYPTTLPNSWPIDFRYSFEVLGGASQMVEVAPFEYALYAGDFNSNGVITVEDFNFFTSESATVNGYIDSDCNLDRVASVTDFNLYSINTSVIGVPQIRY